MEKAILNFQNLQHYMINSYLQNERHKVSQMVEKWIIWILPINGRFKLNVYDSKIENKNILG